MKRAPIRFVKQPTGTKTRRSSISGLRNHFRPSRGGALLLTALLFVMPCGVAFADSPTVNGLFYGDGDDTRYVAYATSVYGSKLYLYFDAPTATLYVALVVDTAVNDNVFGQPASPDTNYMSSVGWGKGGGQQRGADELINSEYAQFTFACAPNSPNQWTWDLGYACLDGSTWVSNMSCGTSSGAPPTGFVSATSFVWNMNIYEAAAAAGTNPWNREVQGDLIGDWVSPFDPLQTPTPLALGLDGYTSLDGAKFSTVYNYEWRMVYEWSIPVGAGGAGCGNEPVYVVTGASHHSPLKEDLLIELFDPFPNPICTDAEDDCFPDQDINSVPPLSDFGDLPDGYGTTLSAGGPYHNLTAAGPYLGQAIVAETDGLPSIDATGDGAEEDGVSVIIDSDWTAGSTQSIQAVVANAPSGAVLAGWFDWDGDTNMSIDADEYFQWNVAEGTNTLDLVVGSEFDWSSDALFARFRLFSSTASAPGGTLTQADSVGEAIGGEVEDYKWDAGTLPVTLNAFSSEDSAAGRLTVRWQTASETDNVGFEIWGLVEGRWYALSDFVQSLDMNSRLPQEYEVEVTAPPLLSQLQLVGYRSRGAVERHGPFKVGARHGEIQPVQRIDWSAPRLEHEARLRERGFQPIAGAENVVPRGEKRFASSGVWKRMLDGVAEGSVEDRRGTEEIVVSDDDAVLEGQKSIRLDKGPMTHVAVTEAGVQRVTYEDLRDGGLDLAGHRRGSVAVTWRGEPVARWIGGGRVFGPGSVIEFVAQTPQGDDALYLDASLYQISADSRRARKAKEVDWSKVHKVSGSYLEETWVDEPTMHHYQSPTGDPWVEKTVLARNGVPYTATLDLHLDKEVLDGTHLLVLGLGTVTDLPDLVDDAGSVIPEHNVEVWFSGPDSGFVPVTTASISGQNDWKIEAEIPAGLLKQGLNQVQLQFSTEYFFSLIVIDRYGVRYPAPYRGPELDFAPDRRAHGYRIEGFEGADIVAYGEQRNGSLTRFQLNASQSADGFAAELRQPSAGRATRRLWVTEKPHMPAVFTTAAPTDLLDGPADLVVVAASSFVGTAALDEYLARKAEFNPVVVDVEDIYNAVGFGMALPSAITDYLAARNRLYPFTHLQLVGSDCYDRLNYISECVSFIPLPTAPVGPTVYSPSQNRLADVDGDGVADVAVGQFSVRSEHELATIVGKESSWHLSGLSGGDSALLIAEEGDGEHDFVAQVERLSRHFEPGATEVLDLALHPDIGTAREAMRLSLDEGRSLTVFSGHSSAFMWAFRGLLTPTSVQALTNFDRPTIMLPLACETSYDISPNANVLGHQLLYAGDQGALAISGAVALSSLDDNERMADFILAALQEGLTLGEAVQVAREALGSPYQTLQDNWVTQGDVTLRMEPPR